MAEQHQVVFDVNVYLDIAHLLGPPFTWEKFDLRAAIAAKESFPHPNPAVDSLRAVAVSRSGMFVGNDTLEVFTNSHIDRITESKATQSVNPDPATGYRGLGWSPSDATTLVNDLIGGLTASSYGGTLGDTVPKCNPPLDHEDGNVFGACCTLLDQDPLATVYCVTNDGGFIEASRRKQLRYGIHVLPPVRFVGLVRKVRTMANMPIPRT